MCISRPITALVVAEDELVRVGLRLLLRNATPVRHVIEAGGREEAVRLATAAGYDVAVVDACSAGGARSLGLLRSLALAQPDTPLVLYADDGADLSEFCRRGGITHFVSCRGPNSAGQISDAVRRLVAPGPAKTEARPRRDGEAPSELVAALTTKEREVLVLLTSGHSSKFIARAMQVSLRTIESHRARICTKLGVRSVPGLTKLALRAGLTSLEDE